MARFFRFVLLLICLLFIISFVLETLAVRPGTDIANVFAETFDGHDYYILSFTADNPAPNTIVSSKALPPNLNPRSMLISSNGHWLFAWSSTLRNGLFDLYFTRPGQPFSIPPIQTIGWSISSDGQYLFYISVDSTGQDETYNFLKLDTQLHIEVSMGALLPHAPGAPLYLSIPEYAFPVDGWKFLDKPIVFLSRGRTPGVRDTYDFYSLDVTNVNAAKLGNRPNQTQLAHVSNMPLTTALISPDGTKLAYAFFDGFSAGNRIVIVNVATTETNVITANQDEAIGAITWESDSRFLLYTKRHSDLLRLYQHDVVTGQDKILPVILTEDGADVSNLLMCGNTLFYDVGSVLSSASIEGPVGNNLGWANLLSCAPPFSWEQDKTAICSPVCTPTPRPQPVGITVNVMQLGLGGGDPIKGQTLYTEMSCAACHLLGQTGPITKGTYTRIVNERLKDPANRGMSPEQYIAQSIIRPNAYVVPGFAAGVMLQDYGYKLSMQDLKDLIAFLMQQK